MSRTSPAALLAAISSLGGSAFAPAGLPAQVADTARPAAATVPLPRTNPFAGFETHFLSNGLKVWFKRLEGVPNVSVSVAVPYGSDLDPPAKEQLAHFTEHMLFSDHDGRTEQEIKDAVEGRGGQRNGLTYADRTFYYVTIGKEHALFALEWLARIVSPHAMEPEVVDRGRQPVAVEINARPPQFFERLVLALNPEWLRPPGFWEREFGMETRPVLYDDWASLNRITPDDLRDFYDRYYAPGAMTLTVVGDLGRDSVLALAERAYGTLPERPVAPREYDVEDPRRGRAVYSWGFGADVRYQRRFKLFNHTAEDELHVLFIRELLDRRLNQRLRYGERKAVYGLSVTLAKRGPAAYFQLQGDVNEDEYDYAVQVLEEELAHLREGSLSPAEFEADRRAVVERVRTANLTAQSLNFWTRNRFYDPNVFTDFPDVLGFFEEVTQAELASFATRNFVPERELLSVTYRQPLTQGVLVLAVILVVILTQHGVSRALTRPIEMPKIRYIARFRTPFIIKLARVIVFGGLALVLARLWIAALIWAGSEWVVTVDAYLVQHGAYALMLVGSIALAILYMTRFPRKLLVFPDHVRVKSRSYASRALRPEDVQSISRRAFKDVWLSKDILGTTALTFGLRRPGIHVKPRKGRALFFRTRDTDELAEVLGEWRGEPVAEPETSTTVTEGHGEPDAAPAPERAHMEDVEPGEDPAEDIDTNVRIGDGDAAALDEPGLSAQEKRELPGG